MALHLCKLEYASFARTSGEQNVYIDIMCRYLHYKNCFTIKGSILKDLLHRTLSFSISAQSLSIELHRSPRDCQYLRALITKLDVPHKS